MEPNIIIAIILGILIIFYLLKCTVKYKEGWIINVERFDKYHRTLCGARDWTADENGKLEYTPGENNKKLGFIIYLLDKVDWYTLDWGEAKSKASATPEEIEASFWGKTNLKDAEISIQRSERTKHHKIQHDYRFRLNALETGEKRKTKPAAKPVPSGEAKKPEDENTLPEKEEMVENIKVDSLLNATVGVRDAYKIRYQAGGDVDWYSSLQAKLKGALGEVICDNTYDGLGKLRGDKLALVEVANTEPQKGDKAALIEMAKTEEEKKEIMDQSHLGYQPLFVDAQGNRLEMITFIQRINYEINTVMQLGIILIAVSLVDYDLSDEDKKYADALRNNAISRIGIETAENEAKQILAKGIAAITPKKEAAIAVINAQREADVAVIAKENEGIESMADALKETKIKFLGSLSMGGSQQHRNATPFSTDAISNIMVAKEVANDIEDAEVVAETKSQHKKGKR